MPKNEINPILKNHKFFTENKINCGLLSLVFVIFSFEQISQAKLTQHTEEKVNLKTAVGEWDLFLLNSNSFS